MKRRESEQIVAALRQNGTPVSYVVFPDEGHGFAKPANNIVFYGLAEAFLAQHLGGRYELLSTDELHRSSLRMEAGRDHVPQARKP